MDIYYEKASDFPNRGRSLLDFVLRTIITYPTHDRDKYVLDGSV